jgi:hypothetical protein
MSKETQENPYITLVQAPGIPASERTALEAHWREAELDSSYTVVTNYDVRADQITVTPGCKLLVQAPLIPTSEVRRLRKKVDKARNAKKQVDRLIVVNYHCRIDAVPA